MKLSIRILPVAALAPFAFAQWTPGQTVQTTSGAVTGFFEGYTMEVSSYWGIPYAQPPIGGLRWAPPQPYTGRDPITAKKFGSGCACNAALGEKGIRKNDAVYPGYEKITWGPNGESYANFITSTDTQALPRAEDCLTLNIWTMPQKGEKKKAVLVFVYGGGFTAGATDLMQYTGRHLADKNIFGFPGSQILPQNLGLLDQRLAMEWVKQNIARFGGDPDRITMFGHSAGAVSLDYYLAAWAKDKDPIINGVIQQSGTAAGMTALSPEAAQKNWNKVAERLGCKPGSWISDEKALECMRVKSTQELLEAVQQGEGMNAVSSSVYFGPVVDHKVVFDNYSDIFNSGHYIKVPILNGNTDNELGLVKTMSTAMDLPYEEVVKAIGVQGDFTCAASKRSAWAIKHVPTWRYRWFGVWNNSAISTYPESGAYHGSELLLIFGSAQIPEIWNTAEEGMMQNLVMTAWSDFAKDPQNGLTKLGWPQYDPNNKTLALLAKDDSYTLVLESPASWDQNCA